MADRAAATQADAITVVIAVKNGMPFVVEAVRSALAQGDVVARVVVVDDGSTDGTRLGVEALADARVSVVSNPGRGVSSARNAGATHAVGRWLLFLDADDRLADGAAPALLAAASRQPDAVAAYGDHERIDAQGRKQGRHILAGVRRLLVHARGKPSGSITDALVRGNFIINGGVMIVDRAAFARAGGFDPALSLCEDWHLWCRLATLGPFVHTQRVVMDYRVNPGSVMMARRRFDDFLPALEAIYGDPLVRSQLTVEALAKGRHEAESDLMAYCAAQSFRAGTSSTGIAMAIEAVRRHPPGMLRVMARVGAAAAGL
jgi:glycosyltransferase involved in cell wall biosynthesis